MAHLYLRVKFRVEGGDYEIKPRGGSRGGRLGRSPPPKTYESNFFHHDFVQFGKKLDCQILLQSPP